MQAGHLAVSKHGVSACLAAQTAIVAVAGPAGGQLAAAKTLQENVKLAPSFLASFGLIYELKDQQSMHTDTGGAPQALRIRARSRCQGLCSSSGCMQTRPACLHAGERPFHRVVKSCAIHSFYVPPRKSGHLACVRCQGLAQGMPLSAEVQAGACARFGRVILQ